LAFLTKDKAKLCIMLIITLFVEKNANFFAENCKKIGNAIFGYICMLLKGRFYKVYNYITNLFLNSLVFYEAQLVTLNLRYSK
jgi:hypothetical protein